MTRPILFLAEGQSNMQIRLPRAWEPPPNLYRWDYDGGIHSDTYVGTAFAPVESDHVSVSYERAAMQARTNPDRDVLIVCIAKGSQPIRQWLPGAAAPDMYAATKRNVEAALAVIGGPVELQHFWWQGETDAFEFSTTWAADFAAHRARKMTETWYPPTTRMTVMGISPYAAPYFKTFNRQILDAVAADPAHLDFIETGVLPPSLWDENPGGPYIHMHAAGYEAAGRLEPNYKPVRAAFKATTSVPVVAPGYVGNWDAEFIRGGMFDPANGIISAPDTGLYQIDYSFGNVPPPDCILIVELRKNGVPIPGSRMTTSKAYATLPWSTTIFLDRGDLLGVYVLMGGTSGSPLNNAISGHFIG